MDTSNSNLLAKCLDAINKFVARIRPTHYSIDHLQRTELHEAELKLQANGELFEALSTSEWDVLREQLRGPEEMCLWHYAMRMAGLAVRREDHRIIRFALMAVILLDKYTDARDILTVLALLLDASKRINADFDSIFSHVATFASARRRATIERFLEKARDEPVSADSLHSVGYAAVGDKESFEYRSNL